LITPSALLSAAVADPILTVADWADANRVLSSKDSAEPGPYRTARTPYAREPMAVLSPHDPTQVVVLMWAAQTAKTSIILNAIGCWAHVSPGPILAIMPTLQLAERWSKQRLSPMIEASPALRGLFSDPKSRSGDNTILEKAIPGGMLYAGGANSPAALRSMPIRYLALDEIDAYPEDVGGARDSEQGEGDPVDLATKRTSAFGSRSKTILTSTPTIKDRSRIEKAYLASDQRRYWVPCPRCGEFQVLSWPQVKWPEDHPELAYYECGHCRGRIENHEKEWMLPRGEWRADNPGSRVAGFHLSGLYAPHGFDGWGKIAAEFVEVKDDPPRLKTWINTRLAETWEDQGETAIDPTGLESCREDWGSTAAEPVVPDWCEVLTAFTDVQHDRTETSVYGWGPGSESALVAHYVQDGDTIDPSTWVALDALLLSTFTRQDGREMTIAAAGVDAGDGQRMQQVIEFVRPRQRQRVYATKGVPGIGPLWGRRTKRAKATESLLRLVYVDGGKSTIYARLAKVIREHAAVRVAAGESRGPGYVHLPAGDVLPADFCRQLTVERQKPVRDRRGRVTYSWVCPEHARNEALDCAVGCLAMLHALFLSGFRFQGVAVTRPHPPVPRDTSKPTPPPPQTEPRGAPHPAPRPTSQNWVMGRSPRRGKWL